MQSRDLLTALVPLFVEVNNKNLFYQFQRMYTYVPSSGPYIGVSVVSISNHGLLVPAHVLGLKDCWVYVTNIPRLINQHKEPLPLIEDLIKLVASWDNSDPPFSADVLFSTRDAGIVHLKIRPKYDLL